MRYIIILLLLTLNVYPQSKMKPVEQLINTKDSGWAVVLEWVAAAKNKVEVLPVDVAKATDALYKLQVTTRSPMGAIVYNTGGILIDEGWIRILGSGSLKLNRTLPDWNKGKAFKDFGEVSSFYLIADDAAGGFFLLNGNLAGKDPGKIYYLAPDSLEYESLDIGYSDFLLFCFNADLDKFYEGFRWKNWQNDIDSLKGDQVFNFYPYLFTEEGRNIEKVSKKAIPAEEQYNLTMGFRKQLRIYEIP